MGIPRSVLLPLALLASVACRVSAPEPGIDAYLSKAADDFNLIAQGESAPKERTLLGAKAGPGRRLTFRYKINAFAAKDAHTPQLDRYAQDLRRELPAKLNKTELFQGFLKNKVVLFYEYSGADGAELFSIKLVPDPARGYTPA